MFLLLLVMVMVRGCGGGSSAEQGPAAPITTIAEADSVVATVNKAAQVWWLYAELTQATALDSARYYTGVNIPVVSDAVSVSIHPSDDLWYVDWEYQTITGSTTGGGGFLIHNPTGQLELAYMVEGKIDTLTAKAARALYDSGGRGMVEVPIRQGGAFPYMVEGIIAFLVDQKIYRDERYHPPAVRLNSQLEPFEISSPEHPDAGAIRLEEARNVTWLQMWGRDTLDRGTGLLVVRHDALGVIMGYWYRVTSQLLTPDQAQQQLQEMQSGLLPRREYIEIIGNVLPYEEVKSFLEQGFTYLRSQGVYIPQPPPPLPD